MYLSMINKLAERSAVRMVVLISGPRSMRLKRNETPVATAMVTSANRAMWPKVVVEVKKFWTKKYETRVSPDIVNDA